MFDFIQCKLKKNYFLLVFLLICYPVQAKELPDFTKLVEKNSIAVVNISTSIKPAETNRMSPPFMQDIPENSPFYDFFRRYFGDIPENIEPRRERSSLGSGFIISPDGYIITNHHVIKDADEIIVRLNDRREFIAKLIGSDKRSDIAVLKIEATSLPTLKFGHSANLDVGEWVLAIGSPFGLDYSVTAGIISAIGRSLPSENYIPFIQTDVAINPGNSGGPLFNLDGEVIGVNSQIYTRTGGFMGLSFAVPADVVENVYHQLKDKGRVTRGWLGVLIQDVTRELAESFDMKHPHGALISKVLPDGPAEKAGIEVGDIIVKFDDNKISYSADLPPLVGNTNVDSIVPVEVIRKTKRRVIKVKISELPGTDEEVIASKPNQKVPVNSLNVTVRDLSKEQRQKLKIEEHGVLIEAIGPGPARSAGIRRGDIVLLINNIKIKDANHFREILVDLPSGKSIPVLIQRQGNPIFLALKIDE